MIANPRSDAAANTPKPQSGLTLGELVIATGILMAIAVVAIAFLLPAIRSARPAAHRSQCKNNLKQIMLALHNYHDEYHAFPPAYTVDADGKPLHSWRTLILPFVEQKPLYEKIDLTKPWDDPANAEAFKSTPEVYRCPSSMSPQNHTAYLAIVTSNSCLRPIESRQLSEIIDGTSTTLMLVETNSDHTVPWMAPQDADESLILAIGPTSKLDHAGGIHAALVDGSVRFLNAQIPADTRRALISIAGNDKVNDF